MNLKVDKDECIKQFKRIYPECPILKTDISNSGNYLIIYTEYDGYSDYFRVNEYMVSSAYTSLEEAKRD